MSFFSLLCSLCRFLIDVVFEFSVVLRLDFFLIFCRFLVRRKSTLSQFDRQNGPIRPRAQIISINWKDDPTPTYSLGNNTRSFTPLTVGQISKPIREYVTKSPKFLTRFSTVSLISKAPSKSLRLSLSLSLSLLFVFPQSLFLSLSLSLQPKTHRAWDLFFFFFFFYWEDFFYYENQEGTGETVFGSKRRRFSLPETSSASASQTLCSQARWLCVWWLSFKLSSFFIFYFFTNLWVYFLCLNSKGLVWFDKIKLILDFDITEVHVGKSATVAELKRAIEEVFRSPPKEGQDKISW